MIVQRYTLPSQFKPVANADQAREAIKELVEETKQKWQNYSTGEGEITDLQSLALALRLSFQPEKRELVRQVTDLIDEAQETGDYRTLFEKWSGKTEYNRENDLDGSLLLLEKRLEEMNEKEEAL